MSREWNTTCADCAKPFQYSEHTHADLLRRGLTLPALCGECAAAFLRERRALPKTEALFGPHTGDPLLEETDRSRLGRLRDLAPRLHRPNDLPSIATAARKEFGVKDEQLLEFYRQLDHPLNQVFLVEAPTGAGKSTFFPYRLLDPPEGVPDPEVFSRSGQIVVTQPRVQATTNIPAYVSKLHGCSLGAGFDVGFRHSKQQASDWRNRIVYVTDGTLINWIAAGQLANISLIMLDEAHERSLNIDLIIGFLARILPRYPRLKLVIASATINKDKFVRFFERHLCGGVRCVSCVFDGKDGKPVKKHFRCGTVQSENPRKEIIRWPDEPGKKLLPYDKHDVRPLLNLLDQEVADTCIDLLHRMFPEEGKSGDLQLKRGDILCFLHGKPAIESAVQKIRDHVERSPRLKNAIHVLPLFSELPQADQDKALGDPYTSFRDHNLTPPVFSTLMPGQEGPWEFRESDGVRTSMRTMVMRLRDGYHDLPGGQNILAAVGPDAILYSNDPGTRIPGRRVVIATNVAETSLTIHGILHVVETGIINQGVWDTATETSAVKQFVHSQAGCTQRWGRAGRVSPGDAWCLYTKQQFESFDKDTEPAVPRSRLEQVVLTAKAAGIDSLDPADFPWLDAPSREEVDRAVMRLKQHRALDADGDITAHGMEIQRFGADPWLASLMIMADRYACAVEVATLAPFLEGRRPRLLLYSKNWDHRNRTLVERIHAALASACEDDLEFHLKVFQAWIEARNGGPAITGNEMWPEIWNSRRPKMPDSLGSQLGEMKTRSIIALAAGARIPAELDILASEGPADSAVYMQWIEATRLAFAKAASETWAALWMVDHTILLQVEKRRDELIASLAVRKKENERRAIHFELLNRIRALFIWCSPDQCYARTSAKLKKDWLYVTARDAAAAERQAERAKQAVTEDDDGVEEADTPREIQNYRIEIGDRSVCHGKSMTSFVGLGREFKKEKPHPKAVPVNQVQVSFVVNVPRTWAIRLPNQSLTGLAMFLRDHVKPQPPGVEGPVRRRLFLDQRFPPFSQHSYRPLRRLTDNTWEVGLTEPFQFWPPSSIARPESADRDGAEDARPADAGRDLSATIQIDPETPVCGDSGSIDAEDPDDSDAVLEISEEEEEERSFPLLPEDQPPPPHPVTGRLGILMTDLPDTPPEPFVGEVRGYGSLPEIKPGERDVLLLLETPTPQIRFEQFRGKFNQDDIVEVEVVEIELPRRGRPGGIQAREPETGLELFVSADDLSFHRVSRLSAEYEKGARLRLSILEIDARLQHIRLSALPILERLQEHWREDHRNQTTVSGKVVEMRDRAVRVAIDCASLQAKQEPGLLYTTADVYAGDKGSAFPMVCRYDSESNVRLKNREFVVAKVEREPKDWEAVLWQLKQRHGSRLSWEGGRKMLRYEVRLREPNGRWEHKIFGSQDRTEGLKLSSEAAYCAAIEHLYRESNSLRADPADLLIEDRYPLGAAVRGRVLRLGDQIGRRAGRLRLDSGIEAEILAADFPAGHTIVQGNAVFAIVLRSSRERQSVAVSLRRDGLELEIAKEIARRCCQKLNLTDDGDRSIYNRLDKTKRESIPDLLTADQLTNPWLSWARLKLPVDREGKSTTAGIILGKWPLQEPLAAIRQESGALVCADQLDVFTIAVQPADIDKVIRGIGSRISRHGSVAVVQRKDGRGAIPQADQFLPSRRGALTQVAVTSDFSSETPGAWDKLRGSILELKQRLFPH